jgi:HK97 family phage major capsid protein
MLDVFTARRQAIAGQVRDLINVRGPRTASQKAALDSLLREADQLEHGIHDETERRRLDAFNSFLRTGAQSDLLTHSRAHLEIRDLGEAGLGTGAASGAGALVPLAWSGVDEAAKLIGPMVDPNVVTIETTDHGNIIDRASDNDTSISATLLAENSQTSMEDIPVLGQQRLGAWKFSSGLVKVSLELLRDSGFDFSSYLARKFGIRMGRGLNPLLSTGTGSSQPLGLVTTILAQGNTVRPSLGSRGPLHFAGGAECRRDLQGPP